MKKIGILGMGGIGSFVGAKLSKSYKNSNEVEVIFICRDKTKEVINHKGLTLITSQETITANANLTSNNPEEIGLLDVLIVATKSYSLATAISSYKKCIHSKTVIIPLQNGVDAKSIIEHNLDINPTNILEGCIYVASNIEQPGVVKHVGGPGKIFIGNNDELDFKWVEKLLIEGGLDVVYTHNIQEILWKKYLFVSPLAVMTSALHITFGELEESTEYMEILEKMMKEVLSLANKFNITLTHKDIEDSLAMLSKFPYASKTSLQLDIENKKQNNEKYNLLDFVINNGEKFGINVDTYKAMNEKITNK
ncbi:ketopantoate reductase [Mesonia phycicola]|uniref:2-dehydropantoate 2-reductase n=1 Tax=Mesonia phycicola TaxID=579105 RepID=A0A1M6A2I8_9FLAO|nr:2-dehydropantoate 2-reductase [Mesonia phycicola]SHI30618.1 ketopantoate reductase [Mesonia phycicola]